MYKVNEQMYTFSRVSCFCLHQENKFRTACVTVMVNKWFERFVTLCIVANSLLLATREYRQNYEADYESSWNGILDQIDHVFSFVFLVECITKIIGMGFVFHKKAYLRDAWNCMDFCVIKLL